MKIKSIDLDRVEPQYALGEYYIGLDPGIPLAEVAEPSVPRQLSGICAARTGFRPRDQGGLAGAVWVISRALLQSETSCTMSKRGESSGLITVGRKDACVR